MIVTGSFDGSLRIWRSKDSLLKNPLLQTQEEFNFYSCTQIISKPLGKIFSLSISSDSKYIVAGYSDKAVRIWKQDNRQVKVNKTEKGLESFFPLYRKHKSIKNHSSFVTTVNISDDDRYIISGSTDRSVKLWMVDDEEVRDENCHQLGDN